MSYLLDTDIVIDYLKGKKDVTRLFPKLVKASIAISIITFGEIYEGIYYGRDPEKNERIFRQFLCGADVLPLHKHIMKRFAHIRGELRQTGRIIGDADTLIAATALYYKRILVSQNRRHFQRIPDLQLL